MLATRVEIRSGACYDSFVLVQLQRSLVALPGILIGRLPLVFRIN